jgi:UrcA family protein
MARNTVSSAIVAACLIATPALATEAKLVWSDLDLASTAGKAELERRIDAAAKKICAPQPVTGSMIVRRTPSPRCLADAHDMIDAQVAARIGHSRLAAGGSSHGGAGPEARR